MKGHAAPQGAVGGSQCRACGEGRAVLQPQAPERPGDDRDLLEPAAAVVVATHLSGADPLAEPFFAHSQYETNVFMPLLRAGGRVLKLDRAPRCTGRIVNGPAFDEVGSPLLLGTDSFASFEKVEAAHTRYLPGLRRYLGKPLALVGCRFYYESSYAASRKTLRGSVTVLAGGRKATRAFAFTICDWGLKRRECIRKWSGR